MMTMLCLVIMYLVSVEGSCPGVVLIREAHPWLNIWLRAKEIFSTTVATNLDERNQQNI